MTSDRSDWPPGADPETFFANLEVLARRDPGLAERLCWPVAGDHVLRDPSGEVVYRLHDAALPLAAPDAALDAALDPAPAEVLVFGVGLGEAVDRLLARTDARVVAWDRDPWLLRLVLGTADRREALASGRLRLALGTDLLDLADRLAWGGLARVDHPVLADIYGAERAVLERGLGARRAVLCAGGLYVGSLRRALEQRGLSTWTLDVERLSVEEVEHALDALRPELLASINYREGLAELAERRGVDLVVWEIDPATRAPERPACAATRTHVHTYRRANVLAYRGAGFPNAEYLPLAADTALRRPLELTDAERAAYAAPVSFVGSSVAGNVPAFRRSFAEAHGRWRGTSDVAEGLALFDALLERQCADLGGWRVPGDLEDRAPGFLAWARSSGAGHDPDLLVGEAAAAARRAACIARLGEHGVDVWGDEGWKAVTAPGVRHRGPATHVHDLTRIYNASSINLDVGRLYQRDIVTMRVFDILACRGFVLAEHSEALEELFDVGREVASYRTPDELVAKARHYLAHPEEARAIAERGHAAVLERHAFGQRVEHMLASVRPPAAGGPRVRVAG